VIAIEPCNLEFHLKKTTNNPTTHYLIQLLNEMTDDSFELYDLRVEVVCPPGERILCGAKAGDYFTLQGEMLNLPAGQGISIYSLCMLISLTLFNYCFALAC